MSAVAATKPLKAYAVQDDEHGVIEFAANGATARRNGGNELGCEWEGVQSCRRAPWADQFAEQGWVPAKAFIEAGWWQTCRHCGCSVSEDSCADEDEPHDPVFEGRSVYCTPSCKEAEIEEAAAAAARKQEVIDAVLVAWPGAEITYANDHDTDRRASFRFPGGKGQAWWRLGEETVSIDKTDLDAWLAFRDQCRSQRVAQEAV